MLYGQEAMSCTVSLMFPSRYHCLNSLKKILHSCQWLSTNPSLHFLSILAQCFVNLSMAKSTRAAHYPMSDFPLQTQIFIIFQRGHKCPSNFIHYTQSHTSHHKQHTCRCFWKWKKQGLLEQREIKKKMYEWFKPNVCPPKSILKYVNRGSPLGKDLCDFFQSRK